MNDKKKSVNFKPPADFLDAYDRFYKLHGYGSRTHALIEAMRAQMQKEA